MTSEHTLDGSVSERTTALSVPPAGIDYEGDVNSTQEALDWSVARVHRAGIQVTCHANGDAASDMHLTAFEGAQQTSPRSDARPQITHRTLTTGSLAERMATLYAPPPMSTMYAYYNTDKCRPFCKALMSRCMACRTLTNAGMRAAAGSDFSPGPFAPVVVIQGLVTRTGWDGVTGGANQRVSASGAVVSTRGTVRMRPTRKTSGARGALADFVALAQDPHVVPVETIKDTRIPRTAGGGTTMYES